MSSTSCPLCQDRCRLMEGHLYEVSTTFKKAVLRKVLPPENRSVHSVAVELGVGEMTIHRWLSQVKDGTISFEQGEENPSGQRNMTEKLNLCRFEKTCCTNYCYSIKLHYQ